MKARYPCIELQADDPDEWGRLVAHVDALAPGPITSRADDPDTMTVTLGLAEQTVEVPA